MSTYNGEDHFIYVQLSDIGYKRNAISRSPSAYFHREMNMSHKNYFLLIALIVFFLVNFSSVLFGEGRYGFVPGATYSGNASTRTKNKLLQEEERKRLEESQMRWEENVRMRELAKNCGVQAFNYMNYMRHPNPKISLVKKMDGNVTVNIGENCKGTINVRFSNGRRFDGAIFNADVYFYSKSNDVLQKEHFDSGIGPAGFHGSVIRFHKKSVTIPRLDHIGADLYLTKPSNVNFSGGFSGSW